MKAGDSHCVDVDPKAGATQDETCIITKHYQLVLNAAVSDAR